MAEQITQPSRSPQEVYADQFRDLDTARLEANKDMLGQAIAGIENFDINNPTHADLRNRFLGSTLVLGERVGEESTSDTKKDEHDDEPPSYMLRVDGGVDVVSSAGRKVYETEGKVPYESVLATHSAPTNPIVNKKAGLESSSLSTVPAPSLGRRVIIEPPRLENRQ